MGHILVVDSSVVDSSVVDIPAVGIPAVDRSAFAAVAVRRILAVGMRLLKRCSLLVRTGARRRRCNSLSLRRVWHLRRR